MTDGQDSFSLNVRGVADLVKSGINKIRGGDNDLEGVTGEKYDSLSLDMDDAKLITLKNSWILKYSPYEANIKMRAQRNKESYLGIKEDGQWVADGDMPIAGNLQFEAEETFISAAISKSPDPVVYTDNTPEGNAVADSVKTMLQFHADQLVLKRKLAMMIRQWSINHLGVLKHGWNTDTNDIDLQNRKIQDFIFDPTGYVDVNGDFIGYLGERIKTTAERLIKAFPEHKEVISTMTAGNTGTEVTYIEWWSEDNTFTFTTFKDIVLDKHKNPYFVTSEQEMEDALDEETGEMIEQPVIDEETGEIVFTQARNHFAVPKKPYSFLSVFSLQEQPHDITGLIEQNIPNQNIIRRRVEQIDYNMSAANNSFAFSADNFTQETAKQAANARKKGNPILVPSGIDISRAVVPLNGQDLPAGVFNELTMTKDDLRTSWGINGILSQPQDEDQTARGMILNQAHDTSRIGGGVGSAIEQVADNVFNWWVQLYYVFYDEEHFASIMGATSATEYVEFSNKSLDRQIVVAVAPDSMKPKDEVTKMNLAQALFDKGAIGPKTLLKNVAFPDADDAAADGVLYKADPLAYLQMNFPELAQQLQEQQAAQMASPGMDTVPPEAITEPDPALSQENANPSLSEVPLPPL